jgi:hypothetical protein
MRLLMVSIALLAGCTAVGGGSSKVIPGRSSAGDVQAAMGTPAEKTSNAAGESVWFYTSAPNGRTTYAVRMGPGGSVNAIEQRLTSQYWSQIVPGKTSTKELRELLGPPAVVQHWGLKGVDEWTYKVEMNMRMFDLLVELSPEGIVRGSVLMHDPIYDAPLPG